MEFEVSYPLLHQNGHHFRSLFGMKIANKIPVARRASVLAAAWHRKGAIAGMLRSMWQRQYKASLLTRAALLLAVLYVVFPFDFIPDFIPVLGWADDGAILYFLLSRLTGESEKYERWLQQFRVINRG